MKIVILMEERFVVKRDGSHQKILPEKIRIRMEQLMEGLNREYLQLDVVVKKVNVELLKEVER